MKFWAWYLEEAAGLLGVEDYRFPPKYIKAFQEKQNPPKPVPRENTLESFAEFLDLGEYVYHYKVEKNIEDFGYYSMYVRRKEDSEAVRSGGKGVQGAAGWHEPSSGLEKDLEKGLLCFCYSCEYEVGFYMELFSMDDNPVSATSHISSAIIQIMLLK